MPKLLSELLGTFTLVFAGAGAIVINQISDGQITHVGIALTFGLVVMAMIYAFGEVSGSHINPAVTIAFALAGRFEWPRVLPYIAAQTIGALLAATLLRLLFPTATTLGQTNPAGPWWQSLVLEAVLTFILMLVILQVSSGSKERGVLAGVAIGGVVALEALFAGPISGASMTPARSLAPALLAGDLQHLWIYLLAPTLGAAAAVPMHRAVHKPAASAPAP